MCGIAGYMGATPIDKPKILKTLDLMAKRGPDHRDYLSIKNGDSYVTLLHSRLAIIDLNERSNQPFTIGDCTLVFNGEIYNYIELRKRLEQQGIQFKTESDTEVLLQTYLTYGEACVHHFEGMWSFAIFDRREGKLFLSRDRFAEKPLYFLETEQGVFFGSEIKLIQSLTGSELGVNQRHLLRYLINGYRALYKTDETFFEGVKEISYATNVVIEPSLTVKRKRYWTPVYRPAQITLQEATEGLRHYLLQSIKIRLRADVPLAFCLSGGVDSTAIASIASKSFGYQVAAFSIVDQDQRYNEYENIQATVADLGCKHTLIEIPRQHFFDRIEQLIRYHGSPISTISYYLHSFLSEAISKSGYRVSVSGTGADELVTGYYDHFNLNLYEMRWHPHYQKYKSDWLEYISGFVRNPYLKNPELYFSNPKFRDHVYLNNNLFAKFLTQDFKEDFAEVDYSMSLLRNRMMNEMFHEVIPMILHEDDHNSMFYSIENRSPYLDSKLFDFCYTIPSEHLIHNGYGKYLLREAVKGILNDKTRLDRKKVGFNASIHSLVDLDEEGNRERILSKGKIFDLVRRDKVEQLIQQRSMPNSYSKFLFNFINAKIFLELN